MPGSKYNRRITALGTEMRIGGPASGHKRLQTSADPAGNKVIGTINNCAGGMTPWGTYLTAEENFNNYFQGKLPEGHRRGGELQALRRSGRGVCLGRAITIDSIWRRSRTSRTGSAGSSRSIRSIPAAAPVKRTALGRFKHEGAETALTKDGRVVVYSGDDERFEHVYKFVSEGQVQPG